MRDESTAIKTQSRRAFEVCTTAPVSRNPPIITKTFSRTSLSSLLPILTSFFASFFASSRRNSLAQLFFSSSFHHSSTILLHFPPPIPYISFNYDVHTHAAQHPYISFTSGRSFLMLCVTYIHPALFLEDFEVELLLLIGHYICGRLVTLLSVTKNNEKKNHQFTC